MKKNILIIMYVFILLFLSACNQSNQDLSARENSSPATEAPDHKREESKNQNTAALQDDPISEDKTVSEDKTQASDTDYNSDYKYEVHPVRDENADWKDITTIMEMQIAVADKSKKPIQTIVYKYDLSDTPAAFTGKVLLADVNFDGSSDILLDLGRYGNQGIKYYACYLSNPVTKKYEEAPEFQEIQNPILSAADQEILSCWRNSASSYGYAKYRWDNSSLEMAAQLSVDYDIETNEEHITEEQLENGKMVRTDAGKEAIQNEWQLDTEVWAGYIAGKVLYEE